MVTMLANFGASDPVDDMADLLGPASLENILWWPAGLPLLQAPMAAPGGGEPCGNLVALFWAMPLGPSSPPAGEHTATPKANL